MPSLKAETAAATCAACRAVRRSAESRSYPLQSNLMALAVSNDSLRGRPPGAGVQSGAVLPLEPPLDPVWFSIPADSLKTAHQLPGGAHVFATALASADKILLSLGPDGRSSRSGWW